MPIHCQIVTQDKSLYEGPADVVIAPATEGEMGVLPNHAPLLTTLDYGVLRLRYGDEEHAFAIAGGILEVRPDVVTVLADVGEDVDEIDEARAEAAMHRAEQLLAEGIPEDPDTYLAVEAALRRSKLRLDAVNRYRRRGRRRSLSGPEGEP
ncbi:MAG: ATP synthase F1 subunit epsilon [Anaerolineales bacterium]|nr:ATP synthase F1 subunit epsilon [Anaerolineales bacterium]